MDKRAMGLEMSMLFDSILTGFLENSEKAEHNLWITSFINVALSRTVELINLHEDEKMRIKALNSIIEHLNDIVKGYKDD